MENQKKGILQFLHEKQPVTLDDAFSHKLEDFFTEAKAVAGNEVLRLQLHNLFVLLQNLFPDDGGKDMAVNLEHLNSSVYCASIAWFEPGDVEKENLKTIEFCTVMFVMQNQTIAWVDRPSVVHVPMMKPRNDLAPLLNARGIFFRPHIDEIPWSADYRITALLETKSTVH